MLFKIAWRNIWRNKLRSLVVIAAVTIGVGALVFMMGWAIGISNGYINNTIENETSHLQIHNKTYLKERETQYVIKNTQQIVADLEQKAEVKAVSERTVVSGMISSARASRGVQIKGINPKKEAIVTKLHEKLVEGEYFKPNQKNKIIIGQKLAEKLRVRIRSKITIQYLDAEGEIKAQAYRIIGLYDLGNKLLDEQFVFVRGQDLGRELNNNGEAHEIAIVLNDLEAVPVAKAAYKKTYDDLAVEDFKDRSPTIRLFESQIQVSAYIITVIIMIALIFGIINTMLMAVLERFTELGMLMAIGMNRMRVFSMIVIETVLLSLVGAPIGVLIGHLIVTYYNHTGIDLSAYSDSLREMGISSIVYPEVYPQFYAVIAVAIAVTAILSSLYPAYKAIRLKPVEAIRKI